MPTQGKKQIHDAGGIRVLNTRRLLLHYAHLNRGLRFTKKCGVCTPSLAGDAGMATTVFPDRAVRESGRTNEEVPTTSTPHPASWADILDGSVRVEPSIQ